MSTSPGYKGIYIVRVHGGCAYVFAYPHVLYLDNEMSWVWWDRILGIHTNMCVYIYYVYNNIYIYRYTYIYISWVVPVTVVGILHDGIAHCDTTLDTVDRAIQQQSARTRGH